MGHHVLQHGAPGLLPADHDRGPPLVEPGLEHAHHGLVHALGSQLVDQARLSDAAKGPRYVRAVDDELLLALEAVGPPQDQVCQRVSARRSLVCANWFDPNACAARCGANMGAKKRSIAFDSCAVRCTPR